MSFEDLLDYECTIRRSTVTDDHGVETKGWSDSSTGVACAIQERAGSIQSSKVGQYHEYTAVGYFLPDVDLKPRGGDDKFDLIVLTAPSSMSGFTYQVIHVGDESGRGHHLKAYLKRVPSAS
ncbi:hypothetical protein [Gimesia fumaroli]|uniref:Phage head-tail joining protein n=1 Tax=Gimesia fumaroli TaxID=2527976 RepID=A0A518I8W6_9PLAN|nr:hypothetical protein [Gimesia fumaroli]QDV49537.1 hypothetical protein Enr17x_15560 [Gimesia fumaroli]